MRRFEFVEGSSAKFWMAGVEGTAFVVVYGKLGTAGTRKEKGFATEELARKELDKKIAEKLREGYGEVKVEGGQAAPRGPSSKVELPARYKAGEASPERVARAASALSALDAVLGKRSWVVSMQQRRARRALDALGGVDPSKHEALSSVLDAVLAKVTSQKKRLPLARALELLEPLDIAAYSKALSLWKSSPSAPRGVSALASQDEALGEAELSFRLGALLVSRPDREVGGLSRLRRRWQKIAPVLEAHLVKKGTTLKKHVSHIDAGGDPVVKANVARLREL